MPDEIETRAAILRRVDLLAALADPDIAALARHAHLETVPRGEVVFLEGEPSDSMIVILSGRMKVFRVSEDGAEFVLATLSVGDSLGELSLIDRSPRSASVQALDRSRVLVVPSERMREQLLAHPHALLAVAEVLARTVRRLTGSASDFVFLDLAHRLAKYLLEVVPERVGSAAVELPASQGGIAAQLGVTRQSLNQALRSLAHEGLIEADGRTVRILERRALEEF